MLLPDYICSKVRIGIQLLSYTSNNVKKNLYLDLIRRARRDSMHGHTHNNQKDFLNTDFVMKQNSILQTIQIENTICIVLDTYIRNSLA